MAALETGAVAIFWQAIRDQASAILPGPACQDLGDPSGGLTQLSIRARDLGKLREYLARVMLDSPPPPPTSLSRLPCSFSKPSQMLVCFFALLGLAFILSSKIAHGSRISPRTIHGALGILVSVDPLPGHAMISFWDWAASASWSVIINRGARGRQRVRLEREQPSSPPIDVTLRDAGGARGFECVGRRTEGVWWGGGGLEERMCRLGDVMGRSMRR